MKTSPPQLCVLSAAIFSCLLPSLHAQTTATTDPVGFITLNVAGTGGTTPAAFTFSSLGLTNSVVYQGASNTVTTSSLTVTAGPWTSNQFNANGTNPTYFVEIITPAGAGSQAPGAGTTYDILSNTADTITLMQNLDSGVVNGAQFKIRAHWTLGSVFGANNESGLGGGNSTSADRILRWTGSGYDIFYYQTSGLGGVGWRKAGAASVNAAGTTLYPEDALIINRFQSTAVNVVLTGAVKTGQTSVPVIAGNNFVGNVYAAPMTLASCGIYTGNSATGLAGGNSTGADQLLIWNPTLSAGAGGYDIYYYQTSGLGGIGWRKSGAASVDASTTAIPVGQSIIINRKAAGSFNWVIPQHPASI